MYEMVFKFLGVYILIWTFPFLCESACTWPAEFRSSTWLDGFKDELVFGETDMTGWDVKVGNLVINNWECYKTDAFDSDGFLELKTTDTFTMFTATKLYGYLCLKMTKVTAASYRYYLYVRKQPNSQIESSERVFPQEEATFVETSCDESTAATGSEYHVMIKSGQAQDASIECPNVFLGQYSYILTAGPSTCDTTDSNWDTCSDTSVMSFDKCTEDVAFSDSGSVMCVDSVPVGTDHLVTVYNSGTVNNINTFRFSCFAISYDGTQASVTPRTCKENQTPAEIPIASDGAPIGSTITMVENGDKCPTCPPLPEISGGSLLYLTDGAVTYAMYTCNSEYDLYGAQRRTCLADHTWDLEAPLCKCKSPAAPDNGNVTVSGDGNTATYTCNAGYIMKGVDTRTCQTTNAWDGNEPTCESCDAIKPPQNGTYVFIQEGDVNKAKFTCDVGTTMIGFNTSTCLSDGTWDQEPPTCVTCDSISFSSSGNISMATDGMVTTVTFSCVAGYTLAGDGSLTCDQDGNWEGLLPICECSTPDSPANGDVSRNRSVATYTCHAGYNMVGESSRYCQDEGLGWNGTVPICEQCATLTQSAGGNANISTDGQTSMVQFTCAPGYTLKGNSSAACGQDLQWDAVQPDCVTCENRAVISSGNVTITTDGLITIATFTCADGYTLTGDATQTCDTDGIWSAELPTCKCILPGTLSNGEIKPNADKSTLYYYCDIGFSLSTTTFIRECMQDGTGWSGVELACRECSNVSAPVGGNASLETDQLATSVTYHCDVGYSLNGTKTIVCTTEGLWETTAPTCSKCTNISSSSGRSHTIQTDGSETTATFTCDLGYTLSGTSVISCDQNGDWKTSLPTCSRCPNQTAPLSGDVNVTTDGQTTKAYFTCKDDYYLEGSSDFECRPEGIWRAPNPVCKCIPPNAPDNGAVNLLNNDKTAVYTCDTNFTLKGLAERNCGDNGTGWSDTQPECVTCEAIPDIPGGILNLTTTGTVTQAKYTCPTGSTINGDSVLSCGSDGTWGVATFPSCGNVSTCPILRQLQEFIIY